VRVVCVNFVLICGERLGDEELSRGNGDEAVEGERSRWRFRGDIDKTGLECLSFLGVIGSEALWIVVTNGDIDDWVWQEGDNWVWREGACLVGGGKRGVCVVCGWYEQVTKAVILVWPGITNWPFLRGFL